MKEGNGMGWLACRHESHGGARDIVKKKEEVNCDREKGEREFESPVAFDLYRRETLETVFKLN